MNSEDRKDKEENPLARFHHSVMNPLTVVVGYAQLLASRTDLDEEAQGQVNRILEQAHECVRIVEEMTASEPPAENPDTSPGESTETDKRRSILVVDDEPVILKLAVEVLQSDYEVVGCHSADEAQRRLLTQDFDLVLLDLNLEGEVGGRVLFETLKLHQPDMAEKVLFMSGGAADSDDQEFMDHSGKGCLNKPFDIRNLRETVARSIA